MTSSMEKQNRNSLSESEVQSISSRYVSGVDKFHRMFGGIASNLERYENDIIYLRIENTEKKSPSTYETAVQFTHSWINGNKELRQAKGFVVSFYKCEFTGFVLNFEDLKNEDRIKQVLEELKSSGKQKSELVSVFSGFL